MNNGYINILMGFDETRRLAHVIHINFLNGVVRSVIKSYTNPTALDHWQLYEKRALYSDYEVGKESNDIARYFVANPAPVLSLVSHDVTIKEELTWLSALRTLVNTKSRLRLNNSNVLMSNVKDSNSSLSLVMTYLADNKFYTKRLSGVDGTGAQLDSSKFQFLTPQVCPHPFSDIMKGVSEDVEEDKSIIVYNKITLPALPHFRKLPAIVTDLFVISKLVMLRDVLSMVTDLLAVQLFEPTKTERSEQTTSDYVSLGFVDIRSKKYRDLKKTALMFMSEMKTLLENPGMTSRLEEELIFNYFRTCYSAALTNPTKFYFQYKKFQSLISIFLMECKLNLFYDQARLDQKPAWKLDYNLIVNVGGHP